MIKPVGWISKSAIQTRYGENADNAEGPSHPRKRGSENTENDDV